MKTPYCYILPRECKNHEPTVALTSLPERRKKPPSPQTPTRSSSPIACLLALLFFLLLYFSYLFLLLLLLLLRYFDTQQWRDAKDLGTSSMNKLNGKYASYPSDGYSLNILPNISPKLLAEALDDCASISRTASTRAVGPRVYRRDRSRTRGKGRRVVRRTPSRSPPWDTTTRWIY